MGKTICETIDTILTAVQEEIEDPDLVFKLRTARQLNIACEDELSTLQLAVEDADLDGETKDRLRELGYLSQE